MKHLKQFGALALVLMLIVSLFAGCGKPDPQKQLVGSWRDSTGILGFDFKEDGTGSIVAADFTLPIVNLPLKGSFDMTYTVTTDDNDVTTLQVAFTFVVPVNLEFTISIDGDILKLQHSTGLNYTLTRVAETDTQSTQAPASDAVAVSE